MPTFAEALAAGAPPIIAILRGISPPEAPAIGRALVGAGIRLIEAPLNSPDPFAGIAALAREVGQEAAVGGGTVLTPADAERVADAGGQMIVSPNTDPAVIVRTRELGLESLPGFTTATEAFTAYKAGARRLKLFPASVSGMALYRALKEVLPRDAEVWAVGGAGAENLGEWLKAGAAGIAVGGALYKAGDAANTVADRARALVAAWQSYRSE